MKQYFILLLLASLPLSLFANDGAYYMSGNQLIPISETDISVTKEILTIKRKNDREVDITVYYEFYNPRGAKKVLVGFEADSPSGDADPTAKENGEHRYMSNFTVEMNNKLLPYRIAMVDDSLYYTNGKIHALTVAEVEERTYDESSDCRYVYNFEANFAEGINIVKHTYTFEMSGSVDHEYSIPYVLTAAKRWANKQIDDFTLIVDMGDHTEFNIDEKPFLPSLGWKIEGDGYMSTGLVASMYYNEWDEENVTRTCFVINKGRVVYHQLNFVPKAELRIYSPLRGVSNGVFSAKGMASYLAYVDTDNLEYFEDAADDFSKKVLRNLPFARRGYVFTSAYLLEYYSAMEWYRPDPKYKATVESLTKREQEWVMHWSK